MRRLAYASVVMIALAVPGFSFAWTEPINISNTPIHSTMGSMTIGKGGRIHVAWCEWETNDGDHDIFYVYSDDNGESWSTPQNICDDPRVSAFPQVLVDSLNTVHIIWDDGYGSSPILWTHQSGDTWSTPVNIAEGSPGGEYLTAVIDSTDRIWAFWHDYSPCGQIWCSTYDGNSWHVQQVTNETVDCGHPDASVDSENNVHLVWQKYGPYETDFDIYYSKYNRGEWNAPEKVESLSGYSCKVKVRVDSRGRPWVIWQEKYMGSNRLYHTFRDSISWSSSCLIADEEQYSPNFIIDSKNNLHLFYSAHHDGSPYTTLYYSIFDGTSWSVPFNISNTLPGNSGGPNPVIDSLNHLHLTWVNWPKPGGRTANIYYSSKHNLTGIEEKVKQLNREENLNFPNPFRLRTTVSYTLSKDSNVTLQISNLAGQIVEKSDLGYKNHGSYIFSIPVELLKKGGDVYAGIYFYRLMAGKEVIAMGKMILLR